MKWDEIGSQSCSIARALSEVGDRWTLLLLREAFLRTRRFADFVEHTGAARNLVADRLGKLVDAGILERRRYQERPERHEYRLTPKGLDLYPVMMALVRWGDRWHDDGRGKPIEHHHRACQQVMHAEIVCSECGEPLDPHDVDVRPGPGLRHPNRAQHLARPRENSP
ncbi:MAG: helix-turn-helix domain-containing protein [Myxococcota bacterium]